MTKKLLHIPTGIIFDYCPSYLHLRWLFKIKTSKDIEKTDELFIIAEKFFAQLDEVDFINDDTGYSFNDWNELFEAFQKFSWGYLSLFSPFSSSVFSSGLFDSLCIFSSSSIDF